MSMPSNAPTKHDRLAQDLRRLVDDADEMLKAVVASGDAALEALRDNLRERVRDLRAELDALQEAAVQRTQDAARSADRAVHEHPYAAVGLAAAIGVLVGWLAARR